MSNRVPFISVITVVLNGEKYIERTINSVINQPFTDYEYILIDGGSTDGTLDIIKAYEKQIKYLISEPDDGISDALNKGIQLATGRYIGFINSDDYYAKDAFQTVYDAFLTHPDTDIFCGGVKFYDGGRYVIKSMSYPAKIVHESSIHHSSSFIRASLLDDNYLFNSNLKYAMDYELFLKLYLDNRTFYTIESIISIRDIKGITYSKGYPALIEFIRIKQQLLGVKSQNFIKIKFFLGRLFRTRLPALYNFYWKAKNKA